VWGGQLPIALLPSLVAAMTDSRDGKAYKYRQEISQVSDAFCDRAPIGDEHEKKDDALPKPMPPLKMMHQVMYRGDLGEEERGGR
jgi:hypothetical protein